LPLITDHNLGSRGDDAYEALLHAHQGLSNEDSVRLNARLVLLLMNHIGDIEVLREALESARKGLATGERRHAP
jgi:hypothetical protein